MAHTFSVYLFICQMSENLEHVSRICIVSIRILTLIFSSFKDFFCLTSYVKFEDYWLLLVLVALLLLWHILFFVVTNNLNIKYSRPFLIACFKCNFLYVLNYLSIYWSELYSKNSIYTWMDGFVNLRIEALGLV